MTHRGTVSNKNKNKEIAIIRHSDVDEADASFCVVPRDADWFI